MERAIRIIKEYHILQETIPISLARLTNQVVFVCAFLTNFQPALVPLSSNSSEEEVDEYFEKLSECSDSECDSLDDEDIG